ncbi:MAG TPA: ABC transporter substrate-binding protein [Acetobacteraceae bacterium]|jgi:peptide/nickel transport system substrate-binding protein
MLVASVSDTRQRLTIPIPEVTVRQQARPNPVVLPRRSFLAASAAALAAPRLARAQGSRVLKFIPQSDLSVLDPVWSAAYVVRNHAMMVFDTLYGLDGTYQPQPQMAEGHRVEDNGRTWLITLRDGLTWHQGGRVLARDCVASIRRWGKRDSFGQTLMAATDELTAPDDRTIRFRLKHPFPLLPAALGKAGSSVCAMMPEYLANTDSFKQITEMNGSGPFRYIAKERVAGSLVVYEKNTAYVPRPHGTPSFIAGPKIVHVDRVEWHVLPDPTTAAAAMQAGEYDWWEAPTADLLPLMRRAKNLTVPPPNPLGFLGGLRFNELQPPFDNPALRRAMLGAVDQQDFMIAAETTDHRNWRTGVGIFCPQSPMASDAGMQVLTGPRDMAAVKRAVIASGYKGEKVVVPVPSDFPSLRALADVGVDMMQKAGLNVEARFMDWATMLQFLSKQDPVEKGGWSAFYTYWSGLDQFDPAVHVWIRGNGKAARFGWPTSPKLEELRNQWLAAPDLAAQKRIAAEIQQQAFVDVPYIPLGQILPTWVYQHNITDVLQGYALFWNVRKT